MPPIGFIDDEDEHLSVLGLRLSSFRNIWGRIGQAVPDGLVLPEAKGGVTPYTYSISGLPTNTSFAADTRTISGSPTFNGDHDVTYTVTDSDGATAEKSFNYHVYAITHGIQLGDFDEGKFGYGLSDEDVVYGVVLESGEDAAFADTDLFRREPRGTRGHTRADNQTVYDIGRGTVFSRIRWRGNRNPARILLYHDNEDDDRNDAPLHLGDWWADNPTKQLILQGAVDSVGVEAGAPTTTGETFASWNALSTTAQAWIRDNMDDGDRFLLVIA